MTWFCDATSILVLCFATLLTLLAVLWAMLLFIRSSSARQEIGAGWAWLQTFSQVTDSVWGKVLRAVPQWHFPRWPLWFSSCPYAICHMPHATCPHALLCMLHIWKGEAAWCSPEFNLSDSSMMTFLQWFELTRAWSERQYQYHDFSRLQDNQIIMIQIGLNLSAQWIRRSCIYCIMTILYSIYHFEYVQLTQSIISFLLVHFGAIFVSWFALALDLTMCICRLQLCSDTAATATASWSWNLMGRLGHHESKPGTGRFYGFGSGLIWYLIPNIQTN